MTEIEKRIPVPDSEIGIYGLFREVPDAPIIVMIHCFTGSKNCIDLYVGARAFEQAGFASFRFDLYGSEDDQRKFLDCVVPTHADDLDLVTTSLRADYPGRPIAVVGHSLGAVPILISNEKNFDAAVLWDPTHRDCWPTQSPDDDRDSYKWEPSLGLFRRLGGVEELVSREYLESYRSLDSDKLIADLHVPVKIILGGATEDRYLVPRRRYYKFANEPKEEAVIEGADHCFLNGETMTQLHAETTTWLRSTFAMDQ